MIPGTEYAGSIIVDGPGRIVWWHNTTTWLLEAGIGAPMSYSVRLDSLY